MKKPLISIVTILFNAENCIETTMNSVFDQDYPAIEYVVIDGGSKDRSVEIIDGYVGKIDCFISEPDEGIADAMNKALRHVTGDYVIFLHAGDYLIHHQVLSEVVDKMSGEADIILCEIEFGSRRVLKSSRGLNYWINFKNGIQHQGAICSKKLFDLIGNFDKRFDIAMDYDFFLRAYRAGIKSQKIPVVLSVMDDLGISSKKQWQDLTTRFAEEKQVHEKNVNSVWLRAAYRLYWPLYLNYRQLRAYMG